ncbi:hypothetical protein DD559_03615 [Sphingomonas pokkalii]|uniref:Uncharacterized protein n=1 Tax=Sphingomonas pokkalii TaxID=2175090 RepID=A0A2U0SB31_9SPHN|nr:hypothetical protein DD559_03615 [Sphingomonas pokkalii]
MAKIHRHPREGGDPLALMLRFFPPALRAMDSRLRGNDDRFSKSAGPWLHMRSPCPGGGGYRPNLRPLGPGPEQRIGDRVSRRREERRLRSPRQR